jgi:hypothetical protein
MNPLEANFRVYKGLGGERMQLATTKNDVQVPVGESHTIKITIKRDQIECFLDGNKRPETKDRTFADFGKVGMSTRSDARTRFDNRIIVPK